MTQALPRTSIEDELFLSIEPKHVENLVNRTKTHEFRSRVSKRSIKRIWVYSSLPAGKIEYVLDVGSTIVYPTTIDVEGIGNLAFNQGETKWKFAYPVEHMYRLDKPVLLQDLRSTFGFTAPQAFTYAENNTKLRNHLFGQAVEKLY